MLSCQLLPQKRGYKKIRTKVRKLIFWLAVSVVIIAKKLINRIGIIKLLHDAAGTQDVIPQADFADTFAVNIRRALQPEKHAAAFLQKIVKYLAVADLVFDIGRDIILRKDQLHDGRLAAVGLVINERQLA